MNHATQPQEGCTKLSVVSDWITQMHFVVETDALIIASVDGTVSFLDVARGVVIRTFSAHDNTKIGTVRSSSFRAQFFVRSSSFRQNVQTQDFADTPSCFLSRRY